MNDSTESASPSATVIKDRNGRLVDTKRNTYTTLDLLASRLKQGETFIVIEEPGGKDLTQQVLRQIRFQEDMAAAMRTLIREGKLPHDLLDQHWFRGRIEQTGPHEILVSTGTDYFPVDALATPEGVPETLAKKDYSCARVAELYERWKKHLQEVNQARIAAGKKPKDIDDVLAVNAGLPERIDGITCLLLPTWLEAGIKHKKFIDAVLKPLSYAKAKREQNSYQKRISENEVLICDVSVPAMWRVRNLYASMGYRCGEQQVDCRLLYWGAFQRPQEGNNGHMLPMMLTTERIFRLAVENIGFLVATLEKHCLEEWRRRFGREDSGQST
jgi:hypothetical protein